MASYDLVAGEGSRVIVGLQTADNELVTGGEVDLQFFFLGQDGQSDPQPGPIAKGEFLPVPGKEPSPVPATPTAGSALDGVGVYQATIRFDEPGRWGVAVGVDLDGTEVTGTGTLDVGAEHLVPSVGDAAISTVNPTIGADIPDAAIDSRAGVGDGGIPDPELHRDRIDEMLEQGRPMLIVFSTPVYCLSQFCGPVTDVVADLAARYDDRAAFIHVEVWGDFEEKLGNAAASEWLLQPDGGFTEPWIFMVDAGGTIVGRWDNVPDLRQIETQLEALPVDTGASS